MKAIENKQFLCPEKKFGKCLLLIVLRLNCGLKRFVLLRFFQNIFAQ